MPRSSRIFSVTVSGNHVVPAGSGGDGIKLQSTVGFVSTALVMVCETDPLDEMVHSYDTIVPGADEVLALKMQFSVVPLLAISQVSVSVGPVTPNRAVADDGLPIDTVADFDAPPYDAVIVADVAPVPARTENEKVALVAPAETIADVGAISAASLDSATVAPPCGAADVSITVPELLAPSVTVASASDRPASAEVPAVTVTPDCAVAPLADATIVALPGATPVTVKVAVDAPAGMAAVAGTVATDVLLLESATVVAAVTGVVSDTVPCAVAPATRLDAASVTEIVELGAIGVEEAPHSMVASAAISGKTRVISFMTPDEINSGATVDYGRAFSS